MITDLTGLEEWRFTKRDRYAEELEEDIILGINQYSKDKSMD